MLAPQPVPSILNNTELQAEYWRNIYEEKKEVNEELMRAIEKLEKDVERLVRNDSTRNVTDIHSRNNVVDNEVINVEATFYTAFCSTGCLGITATGLDVRSTIYTPEGLRVIAVDPSVIPLGSTVSVSMANGDSFTAKAEDTGGDIKGARIDVLVSDRATAYKLGRQAATVEIINE